jgi:hypothetical protein
MVSRPTTILQSVSQKVIGFFRVLLPQFPPCEQSCRIVGFSRPASQSPRCSHFLECSVVQFLLTRVVKTSFDEIVSVLFCPA